MHRGKAEKTVTWSPEVPKARRSGSVTEGEAPCVARSLKAGVFRPCIDIVRVRSASYLWESGRDSGFFAGCGRMCWNCALLGFISSSRPLLFRQGYCEIVEIKASMCCRKF